jgi:hypothetical protein
MARHALARSQLPLGVAIPEVLPRCLTTTHQSLIATPYFVLSASRFSTPVPPPPFALSAFLRYHPSRFRQEPSISPCPFPALYLSGSPSLRLSVLLSLPHSSFLRHLTFAIRHSSGPDVSFSFSAPKKTSATPPCPNFFPARQLRLGPSAQLAPPPTIYVQLPCELSILPPLCVPMYILCQGAPNG